MEVKGDDKIDDKVVQAKKKVATEMAGASEMEYKMLAGSVIMNSNVIDEANTEQLLLPKSWCNHELWMYCSSGSGAPRVL